MAKGREVVLGVPPERSRPSLLMWSLSFWPPVLTEGPAGRGVSAGARGQGAAPWWEAAGVGSSDPLFHVQGQRSRTRGCPPSLTLGGRARPGELCLCLGLDSAQLLGWGCAWRAGA